MVGWLAGRVVLRYDCDTDVPLLAGSAFIAAQPPHKLGNSRHGGLHRLKDRLISSIVNQIFVLFTPLLLSGPRQDAIHVKRKPVWVFYAIQLVLVIGFRI